MPPQLEAADAAGGVCHASRVKGTKDLLGQDEDLHHEYTAEYEAGAGDVVLEGR